jgi:hypothetical protein
MTMDGCETQNGTLCCSVHDYCKPTLRFIVIIQGFDPLIFDVKIKETLNKLFRIIIVATLFTRIYHINAVK